MSVIKAGWTIELNAQCPGCGRDVDLLCSDSFMEGMPFDLAEHGTERSKDVTVHCPECGHEFKVDLEY